MVAFFYLLSSLVFISSTIAAPTPFDPYGRPLADPKAILCDLPFLKHFLGLCPRSGTDTLTVMTPSGVAKGVSDSSGANRFSVKYASAERWADSALATTWQLPNNATDPSTLPLACPQPNMDNSGFAEDCLSMILYVPPSFNPTNGKPVLVWIHGGSFYLGSATGPGLDGSKLAVATDSVVAVIQYRLGALGFMAPDGSMNLAVKDVMNALTFLQKNVASFGGSASQITIAGQSSGASMIRTLLAVPSASSLFKSAILQSDPMDFGFLATGTQNTLQSHFNQLINCDASNTSCQNALSLDSIIDAQNLLISDAPGLDASVSGAGASEPIRPVTDGSLVTSPLDSTAAFPSVSKPILVSTVQDEAGLTIYGSFGTALSETFFEPVCAAQLGNVRAADVANASFYKAEATDGSTVDARTQLQVLGTDYVWRCSSWTFARNWVQNGGTAFVGVYTVGATYPGNGDVDFCTESGVVCHQDDIEIVFGTVPNPTSAQSALTSEMQARYKAFLTTGNPNTQGLDTWTQATTSDVHALDLGGSGEIPVGSCDPSFWGAAVPFDYQVYNI